MKRALILVTALALAGCGGAADLPASTEPAASETSPATEIAAAPTQPTPANSTATPGPEEEPQLTPAGDPVTPGSEGSEFPLDAAVQDLAQRLNIEPASIEVVSVQKVIWRDSSLGCPLPNALYAQVLTEGYRILLRVDGQLYPYHTDTRGLLVLCQSGAPELPVIPITPGDIQDGQPWIPVVTMEPEPQY